MRKTPEHFKRLKIKEVINKILKSSKTVLSPLSISAKESIDDDFTTTDFSFNIKQGNTEIVTLSQKGKGFVDGLFTGLHNYFSPEYQCLSGIKLTDFNVNPLISKSKSNFGTDAQASVELYVLVSNHGVAEFQHTSRSMIYSSFSAALEAFQFYINCERTFDKIKLIMEDASARNRGDIVSRCMYDLSKLTEVLSYEKRKTN